MIVTITVNCYCWELLALLPVFHLKVVTLQIPHFQLSIALCFVFKWYFNKRSFNLQHRCPRCTRGFRTNQLLRTHLSQCIECPTCGKWSDPRHADRCKTYQLCQVCGRWSDVNHHCIGKKITREKRIMCVYCSRLITRTHMYKHFKSIHGRAWSRKQHPECHSEV